MARRPQVKFLAGKPTNLDRAIAGFLADIAIDIQSYMFDKDRVASGVAINSFRIEVRKNSYVMQVSDHLVFAIQGRGPGKFPPLDDIVDWIMTKPIQIDGDITVNQLAFLIGRKIAREGTKGPHLSDAQLSAIYDKAYKKFSDRIADTLTREVAQELDELFSKNGFIVT